MHNVFSLTTLALLTTGCAPKVPVVEAPAPEPVEAAPAEAPAPTSSYYAAADVPWKASSDAPDAPKMAVLSGNPKEGAFTFMMTFPAGWSAPLHTHTNDFAGAVISGTLGHGRSADDHETMTAGSTLSQPGNEAHYTDCSEDADCVIVGHMAGPMDKAAAETAVEGDLAMVITAADSADFQPINPAKPEGPKMFVVSGDRTAGAFQALVKLPAGSSSPNHTHSNSYSAALLTGSIVHEGAEPAGVGSAWSTIGGQAHVTGCAEGEEDCIFFASMDGAFDMKVVEAPAEEAAAPAEEAAE